MGIFLLVVGVVLLLAMAGYVLNIVKLVRNENQRDVVLLLRIVGVLIPMVGAVMGYVD